MKALAWLYSLPQYAWGLRKTFDFYTKVARVPPAKLNLGLAFYGVSWRLASPRRNGLHAPSAGPGTNGACTPGAPPAMAAAPRAAGLAASSPLPACMPRAGQQAGWKACCGRTLSKSCTQKPFWAPAVRAPLQASPLAGATCATCSTAGPSLWRT